MHPAWRADGRELFYLGADRKVYVVPVAAGVPGSANKLFDVAVDTSLGSMQANHVAVSADGQKFLVNVSTINESALAAVVNWQQLLKPRMSPESR